MRIITKKRVRTIQASDPAEFDRKFNEASDEMTENIKLQWDTAPMCVHIIYEEQERVPETVADEFELQGISITARTARTFRRARINAARVRAVSTLSSEQ